MKGVDGVKDRPYELNGFIQSAVKDYSRTIAKTAFSYLKNISDAEDITQEVFLALMQVKIEFENEDHLKAWLIRVAINKSKNLLKSSWFKKTDRIEDDISYLAPEENQLLSVLFKLDVKYRIPLHLYYYEGYSIKEIGEILKLPIGTVGTRLSRGRKLLKDVIGGFDDE